MISTNTLAPVRTKLSQVMHSQIFTVTLLQQKKYEQDKKYVANSFILKLIKLDETSSSKIVIYMMYELINKFHIDWINIYN